MTRTALLLCLALLSACAVVSVTGEVAGTALKTTGAAIDALTFAAE